VTAAKIATNVLGATYAAGTDMTLKAVDDEVVAARGSKASVAARLSVSMNADGTLKTSAIPMFWQYGLDVDASGTTVTVGPGGFGAAGMVADNSTALSMDITVGTNFESGNPASVSTWYTLYLVPSGGAFTLKGSTAWPTTQGVHPTHPTWLYRAAFYVMSTGSVKPISKRGRDVVCRGLPYMGNENHITTPSDTNWCLYYHTNSMSSFVTVTDTHGCYPTTARIIHMAMRAQYAYMFVGPAGASDSNWDSYCETYISNSQIATTVPTLDANGHVTFGYKALNTPSGTVGDAGVVATGYVDAF
jgi:hypothetical protein